MRLLIANANTSLKVTDLVMQVARRYASPENDLVGATGAFGARVIASRAQNAIAEHAAVDLVARHARTCDGVLLAVSYDPGLRALRELLDVPVVAITEASLLAAMMHGTRIGLIVWGQGSLGLYRELIDFYGFGSRICGLRRIDVPAPYDGGRAEALDQAAVVAAQELIETQEADIIVLIGAVLAGRSAILEQHLPVPVVDGIRCAVPMLEAMVRVGARKARVGSYATRGNDECVGLSLDLDGALASAPPYG